MEVEPPGIIPLEKKGTVSDQMGETTPFVFKDRFYRLENYQRFLEFPDAQASEGFRFMEDEVRVRDVEANEVFSVALVGHSFGAAFVHVWPCLCICSATPGRPPGADR